MSGSTETLAEGLNSGVSSALKNQTRPNNIQPRIWNNQVESEIAEFGTTTGKFAKGAKIAGYAGIGVGVGLGIYDNVKSGAPTDKVVSDASVDTAFGLGGLATATGAGALYGSAVPGAGTVAGAAVGFLGGVGYMVITEIWEPGGKSIKDRTKEAVYKSVK